MCIRDRYGTFHRTGAEFRVITCIGKEVYGGICQNKFHTVTGKHLLHTLDLEQDVYKRQSTYCAMVVLAPNLSSPIYSLCNKCISYSSRL